MKNSILFLCTIGLLLALFSCEKEEVIAVADKAELTEQGTTKNGFTIGPISPPSNCQVGDPNSAFRLSPYLEQAGICYGNGHTGYDYNVVVYVTNTKPYNRQVSVFGWRNGNKSSIPNTYTITIPANSFTSSKVAAFSNATAAYSSMLMEVNDVLKQQGFSWVSDPDYRATCADVHVQNCYNSTGGGGGGLGGGGGGFGPPSL